jgi:excisionase family DNA binding protein
LTENLGMAVSRPTASSVAERIAPAAGAHVVYRRFLVAREEMAAAALLSVLDHDSGLHVTPDDPATRWLTDAAPVMVDRVGAALLAGDSHVLLDYLTVELSELRRAGLSEVHLIGLLDAVTASLPDDPSLPDGFGAARRILAEGREHLRRAGARPVRSVPGLIDVPAYEPGDLVPTAGRPPGEAFTDLLLLGALACQAPAALLSVLQPDGTWSTLSYGLEAKNGVNDKELFRAFVASTEPVEISDLVTHLPRSPLVSPPHSMRWAYGVALRHESGSVTGVVVVLDHWLRQVSKREQRALGSLARQLGAQLVQWRRSGAAPAATPASIRSKASRTNNGTAAPAAQPAFASGLVPERHHLLRSQEVAEVFDVTERTVINWAAAGKLPSLRTIGGHLRFRREDVLRLLAPPAAPPTD